MKHLYNISLLLILVGISSCSSSRYYQGNTDEYDQTYSQQQPQITYQQFYNDLSPYGNWINYGGYGYVWIPAQAGFRPYYSNGHWVYTNYGWTWASDYSWGWAPFHYGRWMQDMSYGWIWVPGYEWAPAWVTWRGGGDYYGWAPLGPDMNPNISAGSIPYDNWAFVPSRYINSPRINNYYVNPSRNVTIINNTTIINNNTVINNGTRSAYNPGPPVREVEQNTGNRIRQYNVVEASKPGTAQLTNNTLRVFRPTVNQSATNNSNAHPQRVVTPDQIRTQQNNIPNRNDVNNQTAPVRQFPKEQIPQINRNEPPVNVPQRMILNNDNTPRRVSPEYQPQQNPVQQNPVNRNTQPQNTPAENTPPSRVFRESQNQPVNRNTAPQNNMTREPVRKDQQLNPTPQNNNVNPSPTAPVRRFSNTAPSNNLQRNQMRQTEEPSRPVVRQNSEINVVKPAQTVRELKPEKREE
ncbi:MAG TPA: DUF6600 domain-containing protein [Hanamia sp.]|nr:DUF6600 domain-containing protein [Hanamia sp.]